MIDLGRTRPEGCLSDRTLDMLMAGELPAARRAALEAHLPDCEACHARYRALHAARTAFPLEAPAFDKLARPVQRRRSWWWVALGPALAATALVLIVARPAREPLVERSKGSAGDSLGFFVLHAGAVRAGALHEVVRPGDRLQLVTTTTVPRYLVVFERDAGGGVSVFFPRAAEAARREVGRAVALPTSVELDATIGVGMIYGVFCDRPVAVAPLRDGLARRGDQMSWPSGCSVDRLAYETRQP